jgi:hypothetical protein
VLAEPDAILLDVAPGLEAELSGVLEKHIIADDVALASESEPRAGSSASRAVRQPRGRRSAPSPSAGASKRVAFGRVAAPARGRQPGREGCACWPSARCFARARGARCPSSPEPSRLRIEAAIPKLGVDVSARNFLQEARPRAAFSLAQGLLRRAGIVRASRRAAR